MVAAEANNIGRGFDCCSQSAWTVGLKLGDRMGCLWCLAGALGVERPLVRLLDGLAKI